MTQVLILTTHPRPTSGMLRYAKKELGLTGATYWVLSLHPPAKTLPVHRHWVADPSVIPWRPLTEVTTIRTTISPAGLWRFARRVQRLGRSALRRVPLPQRLRITPRTQIGIACGTSRGPLRLAEQCDLVVALDDASCWAAWKLAQRTTAPIFVNRPVNVAQVLKAPRD